MTIEGNFIGQTIVVKTQVTMGVKTPRRTTVRRLDRKMREHLVEWMYKGGKQDAKDAQSPNIYLVYA